MKAIAPLISAVSVLFSGLAHAQAPAWRFDADLDPLTDQPRYIAYVQAPQKSMLAVACDAEEFRVYVSTNYIDMDFGEVREVTWRADRESPVTQTWRNLPSGGAAIIGEEAVTMVRAIEKATSRVVVKSGHNVREFSAAASKSSISQLMKQCPNELIASN